MYSYTNTIYIFEIGTIFLWKLFEIIFLSTYRIVPLRVRSFTHPLSSAPPILCAGSTHHVREGDCNFALSVISNCNNFENLISSQLEYYNMMCSPFLGIDYIMLVYNYIIHNNYIITILLTMELILNNVFNLQYWWILYIMIRLISSIMMAKWPLKIRYYNQKLLYQRIDFFTFICNYIY